MRKYKKNWTPEQKAREQKWTTAWQKKNKDKVRKYRRFSEAKKKRNRAIAAGRSYFPQNPEYAHLAYIHEGPEKRKPRVPATFQMPSKRIIKLGNRTIHKLLDDDK